MVTNEEKEIVGRMNMFLAETGKTNKAEVARCIGVDAGTSGNVLNGKRGPSVVFIQKFLSAFPELLAEWLMRGAGSMLIGVTMPGDSLEDVEIARLESTVETLLDRITGYKNRIKELEAALPEQKKAVG